MNPKKAIVLSFTVGAATAVVALVIFLFWFSSFKQQSALSGKEVSSGQKPGLAVTKEKICSYDGDPYNLHIQARQCLVFSWHPNFEGFSVLRNDAVIGSYAAGIGFLGVAISPDSRRFAYATKNDVVLDGQKLDFLTDRNDFRFSPDSKHFAFSSGGKLILDGRVYGNEYTGIYEIVFSPDSKRLAYVARIRNQQGIVEDRVVIDGQEGPPYLGAGRLVFSPDSSHFAYRATVNDKKGKESMVVILDGRATGIYKHIEYLTFSPDSKSFSFAAYHGDDSASVVRDSVEGKRHRGVYRGNRGVVRDLTYSPDGKTLTYVASDVDEKLRVVVNGTEGPDYDDIISLIVSPDSKHVAYIVQEGEKFMLIVDGSSQYATGENIFPKGEGEYPGVEIFEEGSELIPGVQEVTYSPDGNHLAYLVYVESEDRFYIMVDGKLQEGYTYSVYETPGYYSASAGIIFSPDSQHFLYVSPNQIMLDGQYSRRYDRVWNADFSKDGMFITYNTKEGNDIYYIAVPLEKFAY